LGELKDLNPYVTVDIHEGEITTEAVKNFDVVVFTDSVDRDHLVKINEFCRSQTPAIGFIWTGSLGLYGWTFVDFGPSHSVFDHNGENCLSTIITSISKCPKGIVTVNDDKRHGFEDDDTVIFREVEGMTEVNDKHFKIKVISPFSFEIGDTTGFSDYTRQGIAEQVKVVRQVEFQSLAAALEEPLGKGVTELQDPDMDWENMNKPFELHVVLKSVLDFYSAKKRLPGLLNEEDAVALAGIASHKVEEIKKASEEWDKDTNKPEDAKKPSLHRVESIPAGMAENVAKFAKTQTPPFNSFWGGVVAQEVVKFTGKFSPLRQWLHYSVANTCLPEGEVERTIDENDRFRDTVAIFGNAAAQKLKSLKIYMIGAGALGCEYLKQFALMGVASQGEGKLTVTDDDSIEISNLNRQFLFRKKHVGSSKAATACSVAKTINPDLNVEAKIMRADPKSENVFTDQFWDDLDCVFGAVDNIHARQYVDSKCVLHKKYLFESGTLGTKCNSQMVVPYKTQSYNDSQDQKEESIPMCTLRNYPYLLDHTIEWSRDYFQGLWANGSADFKALIADPAGFVKTTIEESKNQAGSILDKFTFLSKFTICWPNPSTETFVALARQIFQDIFHDQVAQLLHCFPRDYVDDKGNIFWSSPKRPPYVIEFDAEDDQHFLFIKSAVTILSSVFNKKVGETDAEIKELAKKAPFTVAAVKKKVIKTGDNDTTQEKGEDDDDKLNKLVKLRS
jgi:ubiquitin-activating enzyme E1